MFSSIKKIHFVGIGGIGMSGIAEILLDQGFRVSGSDRGLSEVTERLQLLGARIYEGHKAEHIADDVDALVYSSAVALENPEVLEAQRRTLPVIRRAEMLAEVMRLKYGIGIAGTHGKTTTTSMVSLVLMEGGLDPTVIVGGKLSGLGGTNARLGHGDFIVVEADEFDRSFLSITPTIAVLTTLETAIATSKILKVRLFNLRRRFRSTGLSSCALMNLHCSTSCRSSTRRRSSPMD
jgi:UDP-N-acetylmuramate--alanine ligase